MKQRRKIKYWSFIALSSRTPCATVIFLFATFFASCSASSNFSILNDICEFSESVSDCVTFAPFCFKVTKMYVGKQPKLASMPKRAKNAFLLFEIIKTTLIIRFFYQSTDQKINQSTSQQKLTKGRRK